MMMDSVGSSLTIPVPNIITSNPSGGRFDFDDGGTYCGGWQDGKAHGHGVCTGPKNVGEYSGSWNFGFEMSGVYKWKNGAVYEGRWQNGKRHGVGVEYNGKWIYKGEWSQGFKGRYGVKASSNSAVKYEGTWANGLQDGYGSETYSDGGYYQGQMCRGLRHGYGVRKSAPYGDSQLNNPNKSSTINGFGASASGVTIGSGQQKTTMMAIHSNSLQSASIDLDDDSPKPEDGFKPNIDRTLASKNGFVLVAKPLDVPITNQSPSPTPSATSQFNNSQTGNKHFLQNINKPKNQQSNNNTSSSGSNRRNSLTGKLVNVASRIPGSSNQTASSIFRGLRLRKQKSTSDLDQHHHSMGGSSSANKNSSNILNASNRAGVSSRAAGGFAICDTTNDDGTINTSLNNNNSDNFGIPFTLSPEELDITDPTTVETYTGEWKHDKRNGHGVCERSDGLKYEGQWHNDMKCGYGVTTFKDKTKEEGKYKNNILISDSKVKRFFQLGGANIRQRIDDSVKMAQQAQAMALKKAEIADTRAATARDKADQATTAALEADRDSQIAFAIARQYSQQDSQLQLQQQQQQQQQLGMIMGFQQQQNLILHQQQQMMQNQNQNLFLQQQQQTAEPLINLGLNQSSLQLRRQNQLKQRFPVNQNDFSMLNQQQQQQQQQQDQLEQQNRQQQANNNAPPYLIGGGPIVEPFNGRRGSFRGTASGSQPSSGYHSAAPRNTIPYNKQNNNILTSSIANRIQSATDPFNDLFDHYKSSAISGNSSFNNNQNNTRRLMPGKQASLDYPSSSSTSYHHHHQQQQQQQQQQRAYNNTNSRASVPRQFGNTSSANLNDQINNNNYDDNHNSSSSSMRLRRFRMSSMDHAEENHQLGNNSSLNIDNNEQLVNEMNSKQFKYLITSGEDLQKQQRDGEIIDQQQQFNNSSSTNNNQQQQQQSSSGLTPTSSSYILQQSVGGSTSNSYGAGGGNQTTTPTPSPETQSSMRSPNSQIKQQQQQQLYYAQQQEAQIVLGYQAAGFADQHHHFTNKQRDVHSLADEQLYLAGRRAYEQNYLANLLDKTEYTNYDFTISSSPRLSRRVMRRTASLSRNTPIRSSSATAGNTNSSANLVSSSRGNSRIRLNDFHQTKNTSAIHDNNKSIQQQQQTSQFNQIVKITTHHDFDGDYTINNDNNNNNNSQTQEGDSSHLTLSSAASSALIRKPSLQVRYDPNDLGGLMSREEVAALSHAQREQKRLEAELAEKRAKRPLLHLYLSLKEFFTRQKLILSVLVINVCLFKMFADLIV